LLQTHHAPHLLSVTGRAKNFVFRRAGSWWFDIIFFKMRICFVGAGYVGLTSAAVFADSSHAASSTSRRASHQVWVVDIDKEKIGAIKQGESPFFEPGLDELIEKHINTGRLKPTVDLSEAVENSEIIFIAVGTPVGDNGDADLNQVEAVVRDIAENIGQEYKLIIIKSTVPPGTTESMKELINKINPEADFDIGFCPEFLRPGKAIEDALKPDRIVFGAESERAFQMIKELYQPIDTKIVFTSIPSAEIVKYAANSYLALRIGFIDQIASLAEKVKADVEEVIEGIGLDKRIGGHYWYPGLGYGGYCFPKDVKALSSAFEKQGMDDNLFAELDDLNKKRPAFYVDQLAEKLNGVNGKTISVLGLTAKPDTDDMRGSQAVYFIRELIEKGAEIKAYDPLGMDNAKKVLNNVQFCDSAVEAVEEASAVCVLCEWKEFNNLDWKEIKKLMDGRLVFDAKRMFDVGGIKEAGLKYIGVGVSR